MNFVDANTYPDVTKEEFNKIKNSYLEKIKLPNQKPTKPILLCPVGFVGAGKTTIVKPLSQKLNLARVSTDELRKVLKEHKRNYDSVREIAWEIISELLQKGYSVAVDANCSKPITREKISKAEKEFDIKTIWIHIDPPEEFIFNKLRNYQHTWLFRDGEQAIEVYKLAKENADLSGINFDYRFDTSKENLQEQIEQFVNKFNHINK